MNQPRRPEGPAPFPDVRTALLLTIGASVASGVIGILFIDLGLLAAQGLGTAIGIGGVATLAARRVAEPQAARIGFAPVGWRAWPMILCLVPAVLIASELDNFAYDGSPEKETPSSSPMQQAQTSGPVAEDAQTGADATAKPQSKQETETPAPLEPLIDPASPFSLMEGLIVFVGITPVVHEFLFRGVLQQGIVSQIGLTRGITITALLSTLLRLPYSPTIARFIAAYLVSFAMSWLLGLVRATTGSILGSILLASLWAAVGFAALALEGRMALPGINVEGTHLPVAVTLASVLIVAWAAQKVHAEALAQTRGEA